MPGLWGVTDLRWQEVELNPDTTLVDSLRSELLPLLLSPPEGRGLEEWLQRKNDWLPRYGDGEQLLRYAENIYQDLLAAEELADACRVRNGMGRILFYRADYPRAIEAQQEAYEMAVRIADSVMIGWTLLNIGAAYSQTKDFTGGRDYYRRALQIGQLLDNAALIAMGKLYEGTSFGQLGVADSAAFLLRQALQAARKHDFVHVEGIATLNLSMFYLFDKQYDEAISFLHRGIDIDGLNDNQLRTFLNLNLYEAYVGKHDYATAGRYLEQGCAIADSTEYAVGSLFCWQFRAELAEKTGQYAAALAYYQEYHDLQLEQTGRATQERVQALRTRMRLQEKNYEIQALNETNRVRDEAYRRRRNLLYIGLGVAVLSLVGLYYGMRARHRAKLEEQRRFIAETKLQVLQAQMNPHFIYNAMSGIQNYILKSEKIEAYNYLGKFAALLRLIASYTADVYIDLEEEIKLIRTYLELEKLRFREAFTYQLEVNDNLNNINGQVPSMMIQPVVENAMIHGFAGLERQGHLKVSISACDDGIACVVTDNGRGRAAAAAIKDRQVKPGHLSIASVNIAQRLAFLRKIGYENAHVETEDLYRNGGPAGTRVSIILPFVDLTKLN
ncbi:MAG: histidine kinase [Bacteroidota bacterium]